TYGPHYAVLYGKQNHLLSLPGFNHYFITGAEIPYKFQPGNVNYELSYGILGLCDYLDDLASVHYGDAVATTPRSRLEQAFELISAYEDLIGDRLLRYLNQKPNVRILGVPHADPQQRVPTISFVIEGVDSASIPSQIDPHRIGIRYGDFYAKRLIQDLGLVAQNGVIRVSMVHYNTLEEIDRLISCFDRLF
ncbi:MAG TPA: aminotransferase class V-fold PLP-dependent enzyme, partial [Allocoleopsis sp.]